MATSAIKVGLYNHENEFVWPLDVRAWITLPETYGKGKLIGGEIFELNLGPVFIYSKLDIIAPDLVSGQSVMDALDWLLSVIDRMDSPDLIVTPNNIMIRFVVRSPDLVRIELEAHIIHLAEAIQVVNDRIVPVQGGDHDDESAGGQQQEQAEAG